MRRSKAGRGQRALDRGDRAILAGAIADFHKDQQVAPDNYEVNFTPAAAKIAAYRVEALLNEVVAGGVFSGLSANLA